MSLKAKIEAVIYASEEPVTLAQLVGLLGEEAQAELDRAEEAQGSLSLNETEAELEAAAELDPSLAPDAQPEADAVAPADETVFSTIESEAAEAAVAHPESSAETPQEPEASESSEAEPAAEAAETSSDAPDASDATDAPTDQPAEVDSAAAARTERARMARLRAHFRTVLDGLIAEYATPERGLEIREVAGGFRFATKPEYHDAVRGFVRSLKPPLKLSLQALETLAVIAYKQPVTAPEISEIRGVDSGGVLGSLMARKLIKTAGRKQVIGRPMLYTTTKEFLLKFGLKDTSELPSIEEFERMAGQMAEQEEIPMSEPQEQQPQEPHAESEGLHMALTEELSEEEREEVTSMIRDEIRPKPERGLEEELEETAEKVEPERDAYAPQPDGDSEPADDVSDEDRASIDGRASSLPPDYERSDEEDDPSAREAEIQSEESK